MSITQPLAILMIIPSFFFTIYLFEEIGFPFSENTLEFTIAISFFFLSVIAFAFLGAFIISLIYVGIQLPFAYHYEKSTQQNSLKVNN